MFFRVMKNKLLNRKIKSNLQTKSFLYLLQFWAAYVPCESQHRDAVQLTLEQIDVIRRFTEQYHPQLTLCTSAEGR